MHHDFGQFMQDVAPQVERALVAAYGVEVGVEAAAEAMALAWERWEEIAVLHNPAGYLYRVGQSRARPHVRWVRRKAVFAPTSHTSAAEAGDPDLGELFSALARLGRDQRVAVVLVRMYGFSYAEAADVMCVSPAAVTNHIHRGMSALRRLMGVTR